jgi:hypothetical protein
MGICGGMSGYDGTVEMNVHDPEGKWTCLLNKEPFDRVIILITV